MKQDDILVGIRKLTFEAGGLRRERRKGWHNIFADPESVAEHSHRAAILGYLLAAFSKTAEPGFENIDANYVATLIIFHDLHEVRTGDDDLVQKQYLKIDAKAAIHDQVNGLGHIGSNIEAMWLEVEEKTSPSGVLAKDA